MFMIPIFEEDESLNMLWNKYIYPMLSTVLSLKKIYFPMWYYKKRDDIRLEEGWCDDADKGGMILSIHPSNWPVRVMEVWPINNFMLIMTSQLVLWLHNMSSASGPVGRSLCSGPTGELLQLVFITVVPVGQFLKSFDSVVWGSSDTRTSFSIVYIFMKWRWSTV